MKKTYLVYVSNHRGWLDGCQDVHGVFLGGVEAPLDYAETGIVGCLAIGRGDADALKRKLASNFSTNGEGRPPVYSIKPVERKAAHFSNVGASMQPRVADGSGFIHYREHYEYLPREQWTDGEAWIAEANEAIEEWRKG